MSSKHQTEKSFSAENLDLEAIKKTALEEARKTILAEIEAKRLVDLETMKTETEKEDIRLAGLTIKDRIRELKEKEKTEKEKNKKEILAMREIAKKNQVSGKSIRFGYTDAISQAIRDLNFSFSRKEQCLELIDASIKAFQVHNGPEKGSRKWFLILCPRTVQVLINLNFAGLAGDIVMIKNTVELEREMLETKTIEMPAIA